MSNSAYEPKKGKVYLVGAGPGDPGLLTLRAHQCLARADVVLFDYLANPAIEEHVSSRAEWICLGRHGTGGRTSAASSDASRASEQLEAEGGGERLWSQAAIHRRMVELARAGKTVVRLKGGDPAIFARGAEELEALLDAEVPFEVVPGITAALAAGSYAGIPLTHRDHASAVAFVTGQGKGGEESEHLDYEALARFPGTLVFYMGVTTARRWSGELIAAGKPPDTPVALVRRCSLPDQQLLLSTLGDVAERMAEARIRPPVIVIVGHVVNFAPRYDWFQKRPLFGCSVLVTRPVAQADRLSDPFRELGAEVWRQPAIEISEPSSWQPVDQAIERLDQFDWLVFSSANGVDYFLQRLLDCGKDPRAFRDARLAVVGPRTRRRLQQYFLKADLQPPEFRSESLAESLRGDAAGKHFLLLRASRGREVLREQLEEAGAHVEQVVVYQSSDARQVRPEIQRLLKSGQIRWTTVTSSAIARSLVRLFGEDLRQTRLVSISSITSGDLRQLGYPPAAEAREATMDGVVQAVLEAEHPGENPN